MGILDIKGDLEISTTRLYSCLWRDARVYYTPPPLHQVLEDHGCVRIVTLQA